VRLAYRLGPAPSREEAIADRLPRYWGHPCIQCGATARYVSSKACCACSDRRAAARRCARRQSA
jgi:hypothetical protein